MIALDEKGAVGALGERPLDAFFVDDHAELHVDIGQLGEGIGVAVERRAPEREQSLLLFGKHVRLHPADLAQAHAPFRERGIVEKLRECFVRIAWISGVMKEALRRSW